ncbi:MAG: FtsW/RodA/SpoVE family cell cycle protein, partial [Planctomycetota bacterium]|nr:FtsW/RodA/SpoVE family cell cycle protein [Planctomycetota bacterium]
FIGIGAALLIALPKYKLLGYASWILAALNILLLGVLLVPGVPDWIVTPRNGARAWISLGPVDLQPSEPAKIVFVLVLAWYMRFREEHRTFRGLVLIGALSIAPIALIMLQPDLGQAMLFIPPLLAIFLAAGAKKRHLFAVLAAALLAAPATYPFLMPHQKARIVGLVKQIQGDRTADEDVNMQPVTAQRLIGAGGLTGAGEDLSRALIHYNRLPERHNDMVFSVVVNRWGMMGGLAVIGLSLTWIVGALATAAAAKDPFARLICVGASGFLVGHLIVNVGMNLGLLPIVGVTLPFVSYGGSSLLTMWVMTGLILNVGLRRPRAPGRPSFEYAGGDDD